MSSCTLCDLPTPDPPVSDGDVDGAFCCRGCLEVARTLDDPAGTDPEEARERVGADADPDPDVDGETAYLSVSGMHCTTCEAFVEGSARDHDGVLAADASYPADAVRVTYDPERTDPAAVGDAISGLGYEVTDADPDGGPGTVGGDPRAGTTTRLLIGGLLGMMVMAWYVLFLYPIHLGLPPEARLVDVEGTAGLYLLANVWVLASVVLGYTGAPLLRGAYVSLRAGRPNMDLLVALAATTAYCYSTLAMLSGRLDVYFDVSVVIVLAVTLGNHYEERIKRRAAGALADLTAERVEDARRRTPEGTETVPVEDLSPGEEVLVKAGERIPVDGEVVDGSAAVDRSLVTGESRPVPVGSGDDVVGGAVATDGALVVAVGEDATSTLDRLVELLWDVRATRSGTQRLADRLAAVFVPAVVALAALSGATHLALGAAPTDALLTALAVLVVSCPCALGLATPLAVSAGVRSALERGIVVTDGTVFETASEADVVAFDKTGTLTEGRMELVDVETDGADPSAALARAAAVEEFADHPLAAAVVDAVEGEREADRPENGRDRWDAGRLEATGFERHPGAGVSAVVDGSRVVVGRPSLLSERGLSVPGPLRARYDAADDDGRVAAMVGWDGQARGVLVADDRPRDEWRSVVADLADEHRVVVITGDRGAAADRFREHPGIEEVFAGVPPEAKAEVVERLRAEGTVAMVGDGSNDAPALAVADVGIALDTGTELAADAADAVVTTDDLRTLTDAFAVTTGTRRRIRENLAWAFVYNAVALPLAALGLINPLLAALAMAASSLLVVGNSARSIGGRSDRAGAESGDRSGTGSRELAAGSAAD